MVLGELLGLKLEGFKAFMWGEAPALVLAVKAWPK